MRGAIPPFPYIFIAWWLIKLRDNFIITRVQTSVIVTLCGPRKARRFGRTYHHLQGRGVSHAELAASFCWFLALLAGEPDEKTTW
jgi:hypothetical protein